MIFLNSLGIDFREDRIHLVYLQGSFTGVRFRSSTSYRMDPQSSLADNVVRAGECINGFLRENRISNAVIHLGIPRRCAIVRNIELPLAVRENLEKTLRYEMEKYIPLPVSDIYFGCQVVSEDREKNKIGVFLIAVKKQDLDPFITLASLIQGGVSGIEIRSTAIVNGLSHAGEFRNGMTCISLYEDGSGVEIDVVKSGRLVFSRTIDGSGDRASKPFGLARELEAVRKLKGMENDAFRLILMNDDPTSDISDFIGSEDARIETIQVNPGRMGLPSSEFVPAFGLALRGLVNTPMIINLLPAPLRKKHGKAGLYVMIVLACAVLFGVFVWGGSRIVAKRNYVNLLNQEIVHLEQEVRRVEEIRDRIGDVEKRVDFLHTLIRDRLVMVDVLKVLTQNIPETAWINRFSLSGARDMQIEGLAESASEVVSILEQTGAFKEVSFLSPITKDTEGKERFRIGFKAK